MDHTWIESAELSQPLWQNHLDSTPNIFGEKAIHVSIPDCSLSSIVVQAVESPTTDNGMKTLRIHPLLYEFLARVQASWLQAGNELEKNSTLDPAQATIGPLPIEPQYILTADLPDALSCKISTVRVATLFKNGVQIRLSCIFMDSHLLEYRERTSKDSFEFAIKTSLSCRLVMEGAVAAVPCNYAFAIVKVSQVKGANDTATTATDMISVAYRIPTNPKMWTLQLDIPEAVCSASKKATSDNDGFWESSIPGYEPLREEILALKSIESSAAATGVLLVGCPGVGKSRLASCIAHSHDGSSSQSTFYLSVRDLIFRAATESDLFKSIVETRLRACSLWVIDDLHLLERDDSGTEASQFDLEYTSACNAVLRGIGEYHDHCFILGICHVASKLPFAFTKNGRFEKTIEMLPPTQAQRGLIWNYLLHGDAPDESTRRFWAETLASNTAGCVVADLMRLHQDAWTRCWARNPQEERSSHFEWEDLQEAARHCIPSQLSELDVTMPKFMPPDLDFRTHHQESWKSFAGYQKLKDDVFRQVVMPWRHFLSKSQTTDSAEKFWIDPPPGVLFHGKSGCGKTEAVKCLAASLGLPMIQVRASDVLDKWLGGSEALLRSLFSRARAAAPCILFLDEIDSIACNRSENDMNDSSSRILSTLLNEMDGVSSDVRRSRILVVACTNRLEALDAALLRPGRLQEHFQICPPSLVDLKNILTLYTCSIPLGNDVVLDEIASALKARTTTGADVEGLCREVCFLAFRKTDEPSAIVVSADDFTKAIASLC